MSNTTTNSIETTMNSGNFARRARLSTASIALAIAVTIAAVAAVFYSVGHQQAASDIKPGSPIVKTDPATSEPN